MPYIKVRKQSDGSTRYTAIVRLRSGKAIVHQEARTFAYRSAAVSWAKHREVQLENQRCAQAAGSTAQPTLARAHPAGTLDTFESDFQMAAKQAELIWSSSSATRIGKVNALELTAAALIGHVRSPSGGRRRTGDGHERSDLDWRRAAGREQRPKGLRCALR